MPQILGLYNFGVFNLSQDVREANLNDWKLREETAESMIPVIGSLYRKSSIVLSVYGRVIVNRSVIDILKAHRFVRQVEKQELSVVDTLPVLQALVVLGVEKCHIDIGKMAVKFRNEGNGASLEDFLRVQLTDAINARTKCRS
jgi:glyceraldehyde 3-phosphate dehydrogenase